MTGADESVEPFPRPPRTVDDDDGRIVELVSADIDDLESIVAMYAAFDPADRAQGIPPSEPPKIRSWLSDLLAKGLNVLAIHDGEVVGHAVLMPDADDGWELAIFVTQRYQGAGIGTALLETLLGYGVENDVESVWLTVERWNRPAIALYESVGFESTDAESFEMGMALDLSSIEVE